jgi:hypothetical protein
MVVLTKSDPIDWSFGGGIAQYSPAGTSDDWRRQMRGARLRSVELNGIEPSASSMPLRRSPS